MVKADSLFFYDIMEKFDTSQQKNHPAIIKLLGDWFS